MDGMIKQTAAGSAAAGGAAPGGAPAAGADGRSGAQPAGADAQPLAVRTLATVDELKALSDPTRLAILKTLMRSAPDLPVMSVKEIAEALGESQTRLYRHVRQLEAAGLIQVAASRMVSGILEQRYQAAQRDLNLAPSFLRENVEEAEGLARALVDHFRDGFFAAYRAAHPPSGPIDTGKITLMNSTARLTPARAAELKTKLAELCAWFDEAASDDPDAEEVNLLAGYYTTPDLRSR
jgi:DNA-binding transcriptional ArsR family regulator